MNLKVIFTLTVVTLSSFLLSEDYQRITFAAPGTYPEGVAYSETQDLFYVSSVRFGTIGTVDTGGRYKVFYSEPSLRSSFGMKVDSKRNRLWVCIGDPTHSAHSDSTTFKKMARLIAIDLDTRQKVADIDLAPVYTGFHFPNDVTLDGKGNLYITDSFSPVIYRVNELGNPTVLVNHSVFQSRDVGLNGIVYHPDGFLLVAHNSSGGLWKVPLKTSAGISQVNIGTSFPGADGLLLDPQGNLVLVQNKGTDKVFQLASNDQWQSASIARATTADDGLQNPTTLTIKKGKLFVLNAKLNELADGTREPSREFSIQEVMFRP